MAGVPRHHQSTEPEVNIGRFQVSIQNLLGYGSRGDQPDQTDLARHQYRGQHRGYGVSADPTGDEEASGASSRPVS